MADGSLTLKLDDYTAAKILERAQTMGVSVEALAAMVLDARFFDYDDFTWVNGDPRDDRSSLNEVHEEGRPWSEARSDFLALIDRTFGKPE
ncbi:hypothetical protein GVN18_32710 [Pseudomonas sp. ODNR1LW]|nr:hypothetical protein [Pseudomonas sp. ODNR1LW]